MERLTKRFTDGGAYCEEIEDVGIKNINAPAYAGKAVDKLAEYEDLEEEGLLLKLPCTVGDTVYIIRETQMCCYGKTCDKDISCKECIMLNTHEIHETKFDLSYFYEFGKSVFLTKEEAEQALKKMESEE